MSKSKVFKKGDVIRTEPEPGYYGIAVVLDSPEKQEISPGKYSYPLCHILITPLIFKEKVTINDIELGKIRPLVFRRYYKRCDEKHISWREELCIYIYTYRNKVGLNVIGNIETAEIYDNNLPFEPQDNMCFLCGDVNAYLGRKAYIAWCRENGVTVE